MRPTQTWFMPKVPGRAIDPPGGACAHLEGDLHRHVVVPGTLEGLIPLADRVQRLGPEHVACGGWWRSLSWSCLLWLRWGCWWCLVWCVLYAKARPVGLCPSPNRVFLF